MNEITIILNTNSQFCLFQFELKVQISYLEYPMKKIILDVCDWPRSKKTK